MISGELDLQWEILPAPPDISALTGSFTVTWAIFDANVITAVLTGAPTGLVGVLTVSLATVDGSVVVAPQTTGIVEIPEGTGRYVATLPLVSPGRYYVIWSDGATFASELLVVAVTGNIEAVGGVRLPVGA